MNSYWTLKHLNHTMTHKFQNYCWKIKEIVRGCNVHTQLTRMCKLVFNWIYTQQQYTKNSTWDKNLNFYTWFYTWENARLYPNVAFFGKQILTIPGSYIKTKRISSMSIVLTSLCCCKFGFTNLDAFVMVYKNWPKDAQVGCHFAKKDVREFFTSRTNLLEAHEKELTNLATLKRICNCCNISLLDMNLILTCLCNLHFEFLTL